MAVMGVRGRSLPRIKGWELICKPAKPETMIRFPFRSFDTDLNMCTKWENKIYIKVSRNALSYTHLFCPVSSDRDNAGGKSHPLFPKGLSCSQRTGLEVPSRCGVGFWVALRRWDWCSWDPGGREETARTCSGSRHGSWGR